MSTTTNASVVIDGLLLNLDFGNPKKYTGNTGPNNLVTHTNYNASQWTRYFPENSEFITTGIKAPDGTDTAVRLRCTTAGSSLLRVGLNSFTPNGTDEYTLQFWVRKISGTISTGGQLWCDTADSIPSYNYVPDLITGKWTRIQVQNVPTATVKSFVDLLSDNTCDYTLDFWGVRFERTATDSPAYFKELISGTVFSVYRPKFYKMEEDYITFNRTTSGGKWGGMAYSTLSGELSSSKFLYSNHTIELWFKIHDMAPLGLTNEGLQNLVGYAGYHAGIYYNQTQILYQIWNGSTGMDTAAAWNKTTHFDDTKWNQLVVTRNNGTYTPYINGKQSGIGYTPTASATGVLTGNDLCLGAYYVAAQGAGNYMYYSNNSIAQLRMYNRALTASEVAANFAAHRAKFGI